MQQHVQRECISKDPRNLVPWPHHRPLFLAEKKQRPRASSQTVAPRTKEIAGDKKQVEEKRFSPSLSPESNETSSVNTLVTTDEVVKETGMEEITESIEKMLV